MKRREFLVGVAAVAVAPFLPAGRAAPETSAIIVSVPPMYRYFMFFGPYERPYPELVAHWREVATEAATRNAGRPVEPEEVRIGWNENGEDVWA